MSVDLTDASIVSLPTGVRLKKDEVRDRFVLLAPERAVIVDPIAVAILNEIDGARTVEGIVNALAAKFNAEPQIISADVKKFLLDLSHRRMLEIEP